MDHIYQINPQLDIPIYQQLVDSIRFAVKRGMLAPNQQLPTVQELSKELGIARGTIKRAYDELERAGLIEKVQGRGTFVCYQPARSDSRKDHAMSAIDDLLDKLEQMGLSPAEINIFLNLKLRERAEQESQIKVAVVECNPENLARISKQLRKIRQVDLHSYLLDSIQSYPYQLGEDMDLIVTTATHAEYLQHILPEKRKIARVALRLAPRCLADIIKLRKGETVGVLCRSQRFGDLLQQTCRMYTEDVTLLPPQIMTPEMDIDSYLVGKDVVLVPKSYEKFCGSRVADSLHRFMDTGKLISCSYEMDEGSYLYLEEKIKRLLEEKSI